MPLTITKRTRSERSRDDGAKLHIIMLLIWSCGITSVATVNIAGYFYSGACLDQFAFVCGNLAPLQCCGYQGLQKIQSIGYDGLSIGDKVHSFTPHDGSPGCGNLHETRSSPGDSVCLGDSGPNPLTGATWSNGEGGVVSGDAVVHELESALKCKGVVQPILMRINATAGSWYSMDHES